MFFSAKIMFITIVVLGALGIAGNINLLLSTSKAIEHLKIGIWKSNFGANLYDEAFQEVKLASEAKIMLGLELLASTGISPRNDGKGKKERDEM